MEWIKVGDLWLQANLQLIAEEEIRSQLYADDFRRQVLNKWFGPFAEVDDLHANDDSVGFWDTYDADLDARRSADLRAERQSPAQQFVPLEDPERARRLHRDADPTHILDDEESEPEAMSIDARWWKTASRQSYGRIAQPDPASVVLDEVEDEDARCVGRVEASFRYVGGVYVGTFTYEDGHVVTVSA